MASEAAVVDQAVSETITDISETTSTAVEASLPKPEDPKGKEEEEKILTTVSDDVTNSAEMTLSSTEDPKEQNEENIEANPAHDISSAEETSLLKPKDKEKDEEETVKSTVEEPTAEPEGILEQKEDATATEVVKEVIVENNVSEPSAEVMDKADAPTTTPVEGPAEVIVENDVSEPPAEIVDKADAPITTPVEPPTDVTEVSVAEDSVETPKESILPETVTEEAKDVEPSSDVADEKPVEPSSESSVPEADPVATVTLDSDETVDKPQVGESTSDVTEVGPEPPNEEIPQNESSDSITEDPTDKVLGTVETESSQAKDVPPSVDEPKEVQIEAVVPEIPSEKKENDHSAGDSGTKESAEVEKSFSEPVVEEVSDATPVTEVAERAVEPEVDVETVNQENTTNVEETTTETDKTIVENEVAAVPEEVEASDVAEVIDQMNSGSREGEVLTQDRDLAGAENNNLSCKDLDAEEKPAVKQTLLDKLAGEASEDKKNNSEQMSVDTAKEGEEDTKVDAEAPKSEVPNKKSQGNNLLSKVKKSIVKVKKAIIGKSPSSKTMAPEENSDAKAK